MPRVTAVKLRIAGNNEYYDAEDYDLHIGDSVLVETERGLEVGEVSLPVLEVDEEKLKTPLKHIERPCTKEDLEQQKENKRICGNCYNREYDGYVFVDAMGNIFNPRNLSSNFSKLLEMNGLRHIRFHDLRHSCASLLLANDVPMKQIQEWLGHSDISTTANIYSHLDYKSKLTSANVMDNVLTLPETAAAGWQT